MKNLKNKVAVITGAGSGIGKSVAMILAQEGCQLALVDINESNLEITKSELEKYKVKINVYPLDVANREKYHLFAEQAIKDFGQIDILINNAGVNMADSLEAISYENLDWIMGINLGGVIHGIKSFLPHMKERNIGHIVNVSSIGGYISTPYMGSYCATKYAVRSLSETLYQELQGTGVNVTSVHPGGIKTNVAKNTRVGDSLKHSKSKMQESMEMFFTTSSEHAANKIVKAIKKDKFRLLIGIDCYIAYFLERLFPMFSLWAMNLISRKVYGK